MRGQYLLLTAIVLALAAGCGKQKPAAPREVPAALQEYVLDKVPDEVETRTFIDFEGKVHLLAAEIQPQRAVSPGGSLKLTMYWKSVAPLDPGWSLFTHLVNPLGRQVENKVAGDGGFDNIGPLRRRASPDGPQALSPSQWTPGKVYVDTQELRLPRTIKSRKLTVLVGIGKPFEPPTSARAKAGRGEAGAGESAPRDMRTRPRKPERPFPLLIDLEVMMDEVSGAR